MKKVLMVFLLFAFFLAGCSNMNKAQQGALVGATMGALVGGQFGPNGKIRAENALIGAVLGTMVGYMVGNEMDKYDRAKLIQAIDKSPSYHTTTWTNPDTGATYSVTPQPAYTNQQGEICRKAYIKAIINGKEQEVETTACRGPDGVWRLVK